MFERSAKNEVMEAMIKAKDDGSDIGNPLFCVTRILIGLTVCMYGNDSPKLGGV